VDGGGGGEDMLENEDLLVVDELSGIFDVD
jgi:hypothetical protein